MELTPRRIIVYSEQKLNPAYMRKYYQEHKEEIIERSKRYHEEHPEVNRKGVRKYHENHKQALNKRRSINAMAERHVPLASSCKLCGSTEKLERHHPRYSEPLTVITVCKKCHNWIDRL